MYPNILMIDHALLPEKPQTFLKVSPEGEGLTPILVTKNEVLRLSCDSRLTRAYRSAARIPVDEASRIVLMSDCHRGDGRNADDFAPNKNIVFAALTRYYNEGFTYIELGDGDELWKFRHFSDIVTAHCNVFRLLADFYREGRLLMLYGNHDIVKRNPAFGRQYSAGCGTDGGEKVKGLSCLHPVESAVLQYRKTEILLLHGHQADYFNDRLWRVNRFLVRYLWQPLELVGIRDPTSASVRAGRRNQVEDRLARWAGRKKTALVAGHTHRACFPGPGAPCVFNDGCCVHPRGITAIEIDGGNILLVSWSVKTRQDGTLYVGRDILAGPRPLDRCPG